MFFKNVIKINDLNETQINCVQLEQAEICVQKVLFTSDNLLSNVKNRHFPSQINSHKKCD